MGSNLDLNLIILQLNQEAINVFKPGIESYYPQAEAGGNPWV